MVAKLGNIFGVHVKFDMFANNFFQFGHTLNVNTKNMVLYSYIFSLLTYSYEAWTIGREATRRVIAFETCCNHRILKISQVRKTANK